MRLLVTGSGGQLGGDVVAAARAADIDAIGLSRAECDIADRGQADDAVAAIRPDAVVNCAAWTRVDAAESDPAGAFRANAMGPRVLAAACHRHGALLCHVSTDFVFDGNAKSPVDEWAQPSPLSVYGASKLAGEAEVRTLCPRHMIVRTAWLFGRDGPNFVLTMLRLAREGRGLRVVNDQAGSPTWTGHLAPAMVRLLELGVPGTYHLTNSGATTWHGLATATVRIAGLSDTAVEPITTAEYQTLARRPRYSVLENRAWALLGEAPLPPWESGLQAYLRARGESA